jgi:hypothetical protein
LLTKIDFTLSYEYNLGYLSKINALNQFLNTYLLKLNAMNAEEVIQNVEMAQLSRTPAILIISYTVILLP